MADAKGNSFVIYVASLLLIGCFALISVASGAAAGWIAAILILGNVGQIFMQLALSNTISRTLPKEQTGVGMGLLSILAFCPARFRPAFTAMPWITVRLRIGIR
ncbi:hypothetical protein [uncultured Paenibacillus sp.]|uniref:hypothetical protein n=1 Tax=uncultured Paenibacillus sp. TaxID=227322 RepID=UPI0015AA0939|nr:hypothetical protein [uncultured Paenibacillus sp.]